MLTEDERERLVFIEALAYACIGQSLNLVEMCEGWLTSDKKASDNCI